MFGLIHNREAWSRKAVRRSGVIGVLGHPDALRSFSDVPRTVWLTGVVDMGISGPCYRVDCLR